MKFSKIFIFALACAAAAAEPALCADPNESADAESKSTAVVSNTADNIDYSDEAYSLKKYAEFNGHILNNNNIKNGTDAVDQLNMSISKQNFLDILKTANVYTLENSVSEAFERNPSIKQIDENIVQAEARYRQVQSQKNLNFSVGNTLTLQPKQVSMGRRLNDPLADSLTAGLRLLLTSFGKVENQIASSFLQIGIENINAMRFRRELAYQVKQAFFNRLKSEACVDVAMLNLELTKESLSDADKMYKQGVMALYDVIQSDLQVAEANEQLADSISTSDLIYAEFAKLLNLSENDRNKRNLVPPEPIEVDDNCTVEQLKELANARRFEILSLDRSLEVLSKSRESVCMLNRPDIFLSANYIFSPGYHSLPCSNYQLNLNINWNAWDGGLRNAQLDEIDSQIQALKYSREDLVNSISLQVEDAWIKFKLTDVTMKTSKKRVESAWTFHDMARQRFLNGLGTSLEVQQALTSLNNARLSYITSVCDRNLAFCALEYSVGVDFPHRRLAVTPDLLKVED